MTTGDTSPAALSKLGASKGGLARATKLSPEDRSAIARQAAEARWGSDIPRATHTGTLEIGGRVLSCAVLENGRRLLTQETFLTALGRSRSPKGGTGSQALASGLPPFLAADNLQPFIPDDLRVSAVPVPFRNDKGTKAYGYEAQLLPQICEVYLRARDARKSHREQAHIVRACDILMRGLARVGIIALVDEATGYQADRAKDELSQILAFYISEELRPWVKTFPDEFFRQVYRIHGWEYRPGTAKRTPLCGKIIKKYVYGKLPPGVLEELQARNPITERGYRRYKHHQFLTADTGHPHLDKQVTAVITLLRVAGDRREFDTLFERAFPSDNQQLRLPLVVEVPARADEG